jgi:ribonucleoside-diphosphate reductase alpha chain
MSSRSLVRKTQTIDENLNPMPLPPMMQFDRTRLASELLSLGNPKITPTIAELISQEVEKELLEENLSHLTPELVSDKVRFKLEELGLIEIKSPLPRLKRNQTEKAMKTTHPFTSRHAPIRVELKRPLVRPPKSELAWSHEGQSAFLELPTFMEGERCTFENPATYLDHLSRAVASIDQQYDDESDVESTAIEFYNQMALLDFLPGHSIFQTDLKTGHPLVYSSGFSVTPSVENLFETLQKINSPQKTFPITTLGIRLSSSAEQESETDSNASILLLKLLKTFFENNRRTDGKPHRQDLFLRMNESPLTALLQWIYQEENRSYFSLSLGVSGRKMGTPAEDPVSDESWDTGSFERDLIQILRQHLQINASLRLFFSDRCQESSTTQVTETDLVPNPASPTLSGSGELSPTGYLNLAVMVKEEEINWDRLRRAVRQAVHFLDNVIDFWSYPNQESEKCSKANRSIGLGVMGLADLFYTLRIPYFSDEGVELASRLAQVIEEEAIKASSELAKKRGVFNNYIGSTWQKRGIPIRNANLTSLTWDLVPSQIAQVSPGIEPHSVLIDRAPSQEDKLQYLVHPFFAQIARQRGCFTETILHHVLETGSLQPVLEIPEDIRKVFVISKDIEWDAHLRMASAWERHFDHGVAKLCPVDATLQENHLKEILEKADQLGLKSLWMKRIGDPPPLVKEEEVILAEPEPEPPPESLPENLNTPLEPPPVEFEEEEDLTEIVSISEVQPEPLPLYHQPRPRPERLGGFTQKFKTHCGELFITLNEDEKGPFELFVQLEKSSGKIASQHEALSKLVTLALRAGVNPQAICEQLREIHCLDSSLEGLSCSEAIANVIEGYCKTSVEF